MIKYLLGLGLNITASILAWIFVPIMYIIGSVVSFVKSKQEWSEYNKQISIAKDRYGNVVGQYVFNFVFIKKNGYRFGNGKETISSVIGKNRMLGTLTTFGLGLYKILNKIQPYHCEDSIVWDNYRS